jgi:hypothetical protein
VQGHPTQRGGPSSVREQQTQTKTGIAVQVCAINWFEILILNGAKIWRVYRV